MKSKAIKIMIALALVTIMSSALSGCGAPAVLTDEQEEMFEQHIVVHNERRNITITAEYSMDGAKFMPYKELCIEDDETAAKVGFYYLYTYADNTERGGAAENGALNSKTGIYVDYLQKMDAYWIRINSQYDQLIFDKQTAKPLFFIHPGDEAPEGVPLDTVYVIK